MTHSTDMFTGSQPQGMRREAAWSDRGTAPEPAPPTGRRPTYPGLRQVHVPGFVPPTPPSPPAPPTYPPRPFDATQYEPPQQLTALEREMPSLRDQVAERLNKVNWDHAQAAWARRRRDPIGPHVLLFFYADPDVRSADYTWFTLRVAARLFLASDETDLARLLHQLTEVTGAHLDAGLDPRSPQMSNWHDEMSAAAFYLGVGVSTLDTAEVSWQQAQRKANSDMDVPGQCYVSLSDATKLLVHRAAIRDFGDLTITSNRSHGDAAPGMRRRWLYRPNHADPATLDRSAFNIWDRLDALHHRILGVPHGP
jgi:hypothetical protein